MCRFTKKYVFVAALAQLNACTGIETSNRKNNNNPQSGKSDTLPSDNNKPNSPNGDSQNSNAEPATVEVINPKPSPLSEPELQLKLARPIIEEKDVVYEGSFALPQTACSWSMGFTDAGITSKRDEKSEISFYVASHRYSADAIFEINYPGLKKVPAGLKRGSLPEAKILNSPCKKPYVNAANQNVKMVKDGKEGGWLHGLNFDAQRNRLYYSYGSWYNIPPTNDLSLSFAVVKDSEAQGFGGFRANNDIAHAQKIRGGSTPIPRWFADSYVGGRTLGLGFGAYYSGVAGCSKGPFLAAAFHPEANQTKELDAVALIDYPTNDAENPDLWGPRDPDYNTTIPWVPQPRMVDGILTGYFGAIDEILGAAAWVDLNDKQGFLVVSTQGHGRVHYTNSDIYADGKITAAIYSYSPAEMAAVAKGQKKPWELKPKFWQLPVPIQLADGRKWHVMGATFDAPTRTLFIIASNQYLDGVEYHPLVHAFKIAE